MKRLITAALPYVNNIPHLGNLLQVLSADAFARYCRLKGYPTLYVCGSDEYGTASELKALELGVSVEELCQKFYEIHKGIYQWFWISFDHFGRSSNPEQKVISSDIFERLWNRGFIFEKQVQQLYCPSKAIFLADRYVQGTCPHCHYPKARGDQCDHCGRLLDALELINPVAPTLGNAPVEKRPSKHLFLDLPKMQRHLEHWYKNNPNSLTFNAYQMTQGWLKNGLEARAITRDLKWGVPVPLKEYEEKVFYVWFDAPLAYISITANAEKNWEQWWKSPQDTYLYQFIGKDNILFHSIMFLSEMLVSSQQWTLLHYLSATEYLTFEGGKFSKSNQVGIFGDDAQKSGLDVDMWRFYLFFNRPEKADANFTIDLFVDQINQELIGNYANFVYRVLSLGYKLYHGVMPQEEKEGWFFNIIDDTIPVIESHFEKVELKEAIKEIFTLVSYGNRVFQQTEPWKQEPNKSRDVLFFSLIHLIGQLAVLFEPYLPKMSQKIAHYLGWQDLSWDQLYHLKPIREFQKPELFFQRIDDEKRQQLKEQFSCSSTQTNAVEIPPKVRKMMKQSKPIAQMSASEFVSQKMQICVGQITHVERHPEANKLYVLEVDLGSQTRTIVSGLVEFYSQEQLLNQKILFLMNAKPSKFRGIMSSGMLLAACIHVGTPEEQVELIQVPLEISVGQAVFIQGCSPPEEYHQLKVNDFWEKSPIIVEDSLLKVEGVPLVFEGTEQSPYTQRISHAIVS